MCKILKLFFIILIAFSDYVISATVSSMRRNDTFIFRLGSCPYFKAKTVFQKNDNSYDDWTYGKYRRIENDIFIRNIVHCYIAEVQPEAMYWKNMSPYTHIYGFDEWEDKYYSDPKKDPFPTNIVVDFNSEVFSMTTLELMNSLGSETGLFDCIITDERTSKFVYPSGLVNLISKLKVGGMEIFTDLDEDYVWQFDENCMFPKQTKQTFNDCRTRKSALHRYYESTNCYEKAVCSGTEPDEKDNPGTWYGLFDLIFGECNPNTIIDSEYLRNHHIDITSDTKLKINFYDNVPAFLEELRRIKIPLEKVINYLLLLGNKDLARKSRLIVLERVE